MVRRERFETASSNFTGVGDATLLRLSIVLHVTELALLILSLISVVFFHSLFMSRRVFHVNVCFFIWNFLFVFYMQWLARIATFVVAFAHLTDGRYFREC